MSDLLGRAYQVAKGYLDSARGRLEEIDARAQEELRRSLPRESAPAGPPIPGEPEPTTMTRSRGRRRKSRRRRSGSRRSGRKRSGGKGARRQCRRPTRCRRRTRSSVCRSASDYLTVESAVNKLRERCAPTRFPDGSAEQADAQVILQRVEEAFTVLKNALGPAAGGRFDKLEL